MKKSYDMIMVSHTHWDREWYLTFQQLRIRLLDLFDNLLNILESDSYYHSFHMDGQTIVLEDYLNIKPQNMDNIKKYIAMGKIFIGPWYILPDEFLPSGECFIRNLIIGDKICHEFGGNSKIGYLPDSFGHNSQMPQVLSGFGINRAVFWRGLEYDRVNSTECWWQSPDGSRILATHLGASGYNNAMMLEEDGKKAADRIKEVIDELKDRLATSKVLLLNGCDHLEPQPNIIKIIGTINKYSEEIGGVVRHGSLIEYFEELEKEDLNIPTVEGEQRSSKDMNLLPATLSARMYIKQKNVSVENLLTYMTEPMSSLDWMVNGRYDQEIILQAWKYLIKNHPHDSICGCSIDEVHEDMMYRFKAADEIGKEVLKRSGENLIKYINTEGEARQIPVVVFNTLQYERSEIVRQSVYYQNINEDINGVQVRDAEGRIVDSKLVSIELGKRTILNPNEVPKILPSKILTVEFEASSVPSYGYRVFFIEPLQRSILIDKKANEKSINTYTNLCIDTTMKIENDYYVIEPNMNGTFDLLIKEENRKIENLNLLQDGGDAGDEYTYSAPENDEVVFGANCQISILENSTLRKTLKWQGKLQLPYSIQNNGQSRSCQKTECMFTTEVTLYSHSKRIDIETTFDNKVKDHRLRVIFPCDFKTDSMFSEGQFDVVERECIYPQNVDKYWEFPSKCFPQLNFSYAYKDGRGLCIINEGLPEIECIQSNNNSNFALTLLRCVSHLSKNNLRTRPYCGAGPDYETPGAQCIGKHIFKYSIVPLDNSFCIGDIYREAYCKNIHLHSLQTDRKAGCIDKVNSFINVDNKNIVVSAIKKHEYKDELIIRLFNPTDKEQDINLIFPVHKSVEYAVTDLSEKKMGTYKKSDFGKLNLVIPHKKIVTVSIKFND